MSPFQQNIVFPAFLNLAMLKANAVQTFNAHNMQKEKHKQILFKTV